MHIAIAVDFTYLTPFYVLITSVLHNNSGAALHFHVALSDIPDTEQQNIKRYVQEQGAEITFYDAAEKLKGMTLRLRSYFTAATYYRIILPMLVPDHVQHLLYLDVDTVVIGSLQSLFETDMGHFPAAGVVGIKNPRPDLGIYDRYSYFNAGVLLINQTEWKKQNISQKALEFIHNYPEKLKWLDQCALNAVLAYNFKKLDICYNIRHNDIPDDLPPRQFSNFLADKVVIHYTSSNKPWRAMGRNRLRFLYHQYLKLSPRSNEKKYSDFKPTLPVLYRFVRIRFMEMLSNYPALLRTVRNSKKFQKKLLDKASKAVRLSFCEA
jgi:lipopolysaccharide biosynthesis glycosyltransferase